MILQGTLKEIMKKKAFPMDMFKKHGTSMPPCYFHGTSPRKTWHFHETSSKTWHFHWTCPKNGISMGHLKRTFPWDTSKKNKKKRSIFH